MYKPNRTVQQTRSAKAECCTDLECESGLRNNYFNGKRLTADSFRVEQKYSIERRWLLNRAIHGWGVLYGYAIRATSPDESYRSNAPRRLKIGHGLALDECGRELLENERVLDLDELIVVDENGRPIDPEPAFSSAGQSTRKHGQEP